MKYMWRDLIVTRLICWLWVCRFLGTAYAQKRISGFDNITSEVITSPGEKAQLMCKLAGNLAIFYCEFTSPKGEKVSNQGGRLVAVNEGRYQILGNTQNGECGFTVLSVNDLADNGKWTCNVTPQGQNSLTATLNVIVMKKIITTTFEPNRVTYVYSDSYAEPANITCKASGGRPGATFTWYKGNSTLYEGLNPIFNIIDENNYYTTMQNFTGQFYPEDHGRKLVCVSKHPAWEKRDLDAGVNRITVSIEVIFAPQNSGSTLSLYNFETGKEGSIVVNISSNPSPNVLWSLPNGDELQPGQRSKDGRFFVEQIRNVGPGIWAATLTVTPIRSTDVGVQFKLTANNPYGSAIYTITISSESAPPEGEIIRTLDSDSGLSAGAIIGIVVGIPVVLLLIALIVFARATGRWCFAANEKPGDPESEPMQTDLEGSVKKSDTESTREDLSGTEKKQKKISSRLSNLLPKKKEKNVVGTEMTTPPQTMDTTEKPADIPNPDAVVYAELDLKQSSRPMVKKENEATEYAEIIGTVKPENEEQTGQDAENPLLENQEQPPQE